MVAHLSSILQLLFLCQHCIKNSFIIISLSLGFNFFSCCLFLFKQIRFHSNSQMFNRNSVAFCVEINPYYHLHFAPLQSIHFFIFFLNGQREKDKIRNCVDVIIKMVVCFFFSSPTSTTDSFFILNFYFHSPHTVLTVYINSLLSFSLVFIHISHK